MILTKEIFLIFAELNSRERPWIIIIGIAVIVAGGLLGGICGAGAQGVSLVMYMFVDPQKFFECWCDIEPAYIAGALSGVVAGIAWVWLFTSALLRLRRRSGNAPSLLLTAGNAFVHSFMAWLLFMLLFLAWSLSRDTAIGFLTVLFLILSSGLKWLAIGLIGGTALRLALRNPAPDSRDDKAK